MIDLSKVQKRTTADIARRIVQDIPAGAHVNLGIGQPMTISNYLPSDKEILLHSENGLLGMGPFPLEGKEDALMGAGMLFSKAAENKLNDVIDLTQFKIPVAGSSILAEKNWLAANRDEMADRPWHPPGRHWPERPQVVAGQDQLAGGSWLGLNDAGVVAAVLKSLLGTSLAFLLLQNFKGKKLRLH